MSEPRRQWKVLLTIEVTAIVDALPEWTRQEVLDIAEDAGWGAKPGHPDVTFAEFTVSTDEETITHD